MRTVLGIDLGTQALKVVFYDIDARRVAAVESAPLSLYQNERGRAEQQAHWWVEALQKALGKVGSSVRATASAVGVSGQQHGFVPLDAAGNVLAPVKLWCDTSTEAECAEIMAAAGGEARCLHDAGNLIPPGFTASKVLWLRKHHPALYAQMATILLPHDYLNFYLTSERCMEMGDASGTGFLDVRNRAWSETLLRAIDPDRDLQDCLPTLRIANEAIGTLQTGVAEELGLPAGIPVAIGGGDNMMGAIGTGNVRSGRVTMSLGTSGTVYAYSDEPVVDPSGQIAAFCSSTGGWLPLLCTMNCTVTTELTRSLLDADLAEFEAHLESAPPGASGVITVPFFNGERTPNLPGAKGCIVGLDSQNMKPENLLRSGVEGATFALKFGIDQLEALGLQASEIVLTGGGVNSPSWRQVVADIFGLPVTVMQQDQGAAPGAAMQAMALLADQPDSLGDIVDTHLTPDPDRSCEPSESAVNLYQDVYASYQDAVAAAAQLYGQSAATTQGRRES
ncbi:MAG: xylulokinase [Pseudomonadota bacterium]